MQFTDWKSVQPFSRYLQKSVVILTKNAILHYCDHVSGPIVSKLTPNTGHTQRYKFHLPSQRYFVMTQWRHICVFTPKIYLPSGEFTVILLDIAKVSKLNLTTPEIQILWNQIENFLQGGISLRAQDANYKCLIFDTSSILYPCWALWLTIIGRYNPV